MKLLALKQFQHVLNDHADQLAGKYQSCQRPHVTLKKPLPPPNYKIHLLYDSSVITSKVKSVIQNTLFSSSIKAHIMKKARWTKRTFDLVHWDAHERAFRRLPRYSQHSMAKLVHGLVNTNRQNHLYYGQSFSCPICQGPEETLLHVFTCPNSEAAAYRLLRLDELYTDLLKANTPPPILAAIKHGFSSWLQNPESTDIKAMTAGSLRGPDAVLTAAFHEQVNHIGWYNFCLDRVSKKWAMAAHQYDSSSPAADGKLQWASILVASLWRLSRSLWKYRNEVVHGATVEEQAQLQLNNLRSQITSFYTAYETNPHLVLPRHQTLFTSRSLEERLGASYDTMSAWLRSVEEAIQVLKHQEDIQRAASQLFFPLSTVHPEDQPSDTDATYTYHTPGTMDSWSFDSTEATASTTTLSSAASSASLNTLSSAASSASAHIFLRYDSDEDSNGSVTTVTSMLNTLPSELYSLDTSDLVTSDSSSSQSRSLDDLSSLCSNDSPSVPWAVHCG
jgi:hypothetical protein